jgi:hypothetical protein
MCPDKDKKAGMYTFSFNVEEILPKQKLIPNDGWKTWLWADWLEDNERNSGMHTKHASQ